MNYNLSVLSKYTNSNNINDYYKFKQIKMSSYFFSYEENDTETDLQ